MCRLVVVAVTDAWREMGCLCHSFRAHRRHMDDCSLSAGVTNGQLISRSGGIINSGVSVVADSKKDSLLHAVGTVYRRLLRYARMWAGRVG